MFPLVKMTNINKTYKGIRKESDLHVLKDVSIQLFPGELVAIMGKSGSGKSTLLNILGCLDKYDSGEYKFCGEKVSDLSDTSLSRIRGKNISFIFQDFALIEEETVLENIKTPLYFDPKIGIFKMRLLAENAAKRIGIEDLLHKKVYYLSGGQKQRVAIARAIVSNPKLILADEPTGSLDSATASNVMDILMTIFHQGTTVVIVTHDPDIASSCNRIFHIEDGRIGELSGEIAK